MVDMLDVFNQLIGSENLCCVDRIELPARPERTADVPGAYRDGSPGRWLMNDRKLKGRLWLHQAKAMEAAAQGRNIVISTGTASGKSLVFQSIALRMLEKDNESAVLVFYPLKALAADQFKSWERVAEFAGVPKNAIVKIDGDVPRAERASLLSYARIALLTPDICHAWLLNEISKQTHRDFLARASLVVIDEAHVLEGVFGSNFAYLFRRLCAARALIRPKRRSAPLQVVAATATIFDPKKHLHALTGFDFEAVEEVEEDDGSPSHPRSIVHVCSKDEIVFEEMGEVLRHLVDESDNGSFITFIDSCQGAERIAVGVKRDNLVKPYRSGYEVGDRAEIENALSAGSLRGVVSTSALELGIDIPHFAVGLNIGVPATRKSFRQRLGRVGRQRPGCFAVFADPSAFRKYGTTLADYYQASIEPSYLYLNNRFMQYAHARCLAEEMEMLGVSGKKTLSSSVLWPNGFADVFDFSYVGGPSARPREFDQIAKIGGDQPHFNYPLRNVPEEAFNVVVGRGGPVAGAPPIAQLSLQQAIREAFPGAIYLHMAKGWRVHEWRSALSGRTIRVSPAKTPILPKPIKRTFVNLSLEREGLVEGHYRGSKNGFFAECHLEVTEKVIGFSENGKQKLYIDLRQQNPGMAPKTRYFRTTGVAMKVEQDGFHSVKKRVADALRELMLREYSILPQDVGAVATNISLIEDGKLKPVSDVVVLFDATYGSLRLTEPVYLEFDRLLEKLDRAVEMTLSHDRFLSEGTLSGLRQWFEDLADEDNAGVRESVVSNSEPWVRVLEKGSVVAKRDVQNVLRDIEITGYELMEFDGAMQLFYRYKASVGSALVSARDVEPVGDEWTWVDWNPVTGETRESLDESENTTA